MTDEPKVPSLWDRLPFEVKAMIIELVEGQADKAALCRCSKALYEIVCPALYRHCRLTLKSGSCRGFYFEPPPAGLDGLCSPSNRGLKYVEAIDVLFLEKSYSNVQRHVHDPLDKLRSRMARKTPCMLVWSSDRQFILWRVDTKMLEIIPMDEAPVGEHCWVEAFK